MKPAHAVGFTQKGGIGRQLDSLPTADFHHGPLHFPHWPLMITRANPITLPVPARYIRTIWFSDSRQSSPDPYQNFQRSSKASPIFSHAHARTQPRPSPGLQSKR